MVALPVSAVSLTMSKQVKLLTRDFACLYKPWLSDAGISEALASRACST